MLVDDEAQAGSSEGPGTTQWRHPSLRKDCARSDVGPSSRVKEPSSSRKNPTKKKAKGPAEDGQGSGAKPRRASTSDQQPAAVVQHHHHYYHPPSADVPGFSSPLPLASPLTSQVGSSVSDNVRRPSALPRHTQQPAFVNPTPPTSDIGSSPYSDMGKELAPALDQGLLKALALDANVNSDLDSDEDALFYTPRSSMTFNFQTEDASSSDGHSQYEEDVGLSPKAAAQQSGLTAPSLTFQPPTPTSFPLQDGQSRSPFSPGQAPGQEKNLFSEYSFHPDRVRSQQPEAPPSPMVFLQEDEPAPTQPPRPAFFNENRSSSPNSSSPPSSSPRMSALGGDDDDAYSGVLLYALPEEDEGPNSIAALPPAPPRLPSIPHISPLATPSLTNLGNSSSLHPGGNSRKAESVRSAASSSSRYSQTSYASYASELDAPKPRIISANSTPFSTASTVSSPLSSPMRPTPSSSSYSRNRSTSPSQSSSNLKSPMFPGAPSSDSPPTAPSSLYSMPPRLTPFLPRPTSMLINSYDMAGSYPSAPASVVSDSGHRQHRKDSLPALSLGAAGGQRTDESRSMRSFNPGASEGGFQRRRLMSEGASMREVRSTPQVMGDSAKGQGGTSMSGGAGYSYVIASPRVQTYPRETDISTTLRPAALSPCPRRSIGPQSRPRATRARSPTIPWECPTRRWRRSWSAPAPDGRPRPSLLPRPPCRLSCAGTQSRPLPLISFRHLSSRFSTLPTRRLPKSCRPPAFSSGSGPSPSTATTPSPPEMPRQGSSPGGASRVRSSSGAMRARACSARASSSLVSGISSGRGRSASSS